MQYSDVEYVSYVSLGAEACLCLKTHTEESEDMYLKWSCFLFGTGTLVFCFAHVHTFHRPLSLGEPRVLTSASVDSGGAERFPHDGLTDVSGNKEGDSRAEAIPFLQKFIQK